MNFNTRGGLKLQIEISNKKLGKKIYDLNALSKDIGFEMAKKLKQRISELDAAENFKEYLDTGLGDPHPLVGNLDKHFGIKINKNYRLIVEPLSEKLDNNSLKKCEKVNLKGVADYHDGKCEWLIPWIFSSSGGDN